jgi:hypothetical protein
MFVRTLMQTQFGSEFSQDKLELHGNDWISELIGLAAEHAKTSRSLVGTQIEILISN